MTWGLNNPDPHSTNIEGIILSCWLAIPKIKTVTVDYPATRLPLKFQRPYQVILVAVRLKNKSYPAAVAFGNFNI